MSPSSEIIVEVDSQLEPLIPKFLGTQKDQVAQMKVALQGKNFNELKALGHKMAGSCGGYGFSLMGQIGKSIETAAEANDLAKVTEGVNQLEDYVPRIKVEYKK